MKKILMLVLVLSWILFSTSCASTASEKEPSTMQKLINTAAKVRDEILNEVGKTPEPVYDEHIVYVHYEPNNNGIMILDILVMFKDQKIANFFIGAVKRKGKVDLDAPSSYGDYQIQGSQVTFNYIGKKARTEIGSIEGQIITLNGLEYKYYENK